MYMYLVLYITANIVMKSEFDIVTSIYYVRALEAYLDK